LGWITLLNGPTRIYSSSPCGPAFLHFHPTLARGPNPRVCSSSTPVQTPELRTHPSIHGHAWTAKKEKKRKKEDGLGLAASRVRSSPAVPTAGSTRAGTNARPPCRPPPRRRRPPPAIRPRVRRLSLPLQQSPPRLRPLRLPHRRPQAIRRNAAPQPRVLVLRLRRRGIRAVLRRYSRARGAAAGTARTLFALGALAAGCSRARDIVAGTQVHACAAKFGVRQVRVWTRRGGRSRSAPHWSVVSWATMTACLVNHCSSGYHTTMAQQLRCSRKCWFRRFGLPMPEVLSVGIQAHGCLPKMGTEVHSALGLP
jgi:hypothetical protein